MELIKRKPNRLMGYDYDSPGGYFITVCTKHFKNVFWENVGATSGRPKKSNLSKNGEIVRDAIERIAFTYPAVNVDCFVVMPNHVHLLLQIQSAEDGRAMPAPTVSRIVQQFKGYVTKRIGFPVWQKLFHDHVIRGSGDYAAIQKYILENPSRWEEDNFYMEIE